MLASNKIRRLYCLVIRAAADALLSLPIYRDETRSALLSRSSQLTERRLKAYINPRIEPCTSLLVSIETPAEIFKSEPRSRPQLARSLSAETMRRSSARKSGSQAPANSSSDFFRSATSKAGSKEAERIDNLFLTYVDESSSLIGPEGIESFCSDLEVDVTDVRILMLAWKMKAEKQGYFTAEEWRRGLKALHADTISKIKKVMPELEKEVTRPTNFLDFYEYAFRYCLTEDKQKSIDIESTCELLDLVLGFQFRPQVNKIIEYLKNQHDYKVINKDQWTSFLRFCNEINFPSLDNYDADLAWPIILDNFVEWMREKQS